MYSPPMMKDLVSLDLMCNSCGTGDIEPGVRHIPCYSGGG